MNNASYPAFSGLGTGSLAHTKPLGRIALINSIVEYRDAISANVADHALALRMLGYDVSVFSYNCDYDLDYIKINDLKDLLLHKNYLNADVLIWHFGIYYQLFDAIQIGNGRAPRVVCFHNVTPPEFVPEANRRTIEISLRQAYLMRYADEVWADSDINAQAAREIDVLPERVITVPLIVNDPAPILLSGKAIEPIELVYVGRFTKAKGVAELLEAICIMPREQQKLLSVTLAGNVAFSDPVYVKHLKSLLDDERIQASIRLVESPDDDELFALYAKAHILAIPSYHEGFCKPVIEGLRSGCIPLGYRSYNLPFVANGLGRMVSPGDIPALASACSELIAALRSKEGDGSRSPLPLDRGLTTIIDFDRLASQHIGKFEATQVRSLIAARAARLIGGLQEA